MDEEGVVVVVVVFFFKQKTAYEIKECDWSSDVCSSDLYYDLPSGHDWYAQVDDFTIGSCRALPGGLIVGQEIGRASCRERV